MAEPQSEIRNDWKREIEEYRGELRALADELRVKVHLAGMDARSAWDQLEPRFFDFEQRAGAAAQATAKELRIAARELKAHANRIRDSL